MLLSSALALCALLQVITPGHAPGAQAGLPPSTRVARPWVETFGGSNADRLVDAAPLGGGVAAVGQTFSFGAGSSDAWVLCADAMGRSRYEFALGGAGSDELRSVAATPDGGCILAGSTSSFGAGGSDGWVVKLAGDGAIEWQRTYGTAADEVLAAVARVPGPTVAPRYYVAGTAASAAAGREAWVLALDATGAPLWEKTYGGKLDEDMTSMAATPDGLVFVAGSRSAFGGPAVPFTRPWLVRLDTAGEPVVQRTFNASGGDVLTSIVALEDGTFATTGEILANAFFRGDVWVQRLDASLDVIWDQRFGDNFINWVDAGSSVRATPNGDLLVAGSTGTAGEGSEDLWLLLLDGAGNLIADRTFGGPGFDGGSALALDPAGLVFLGGFVQRQPLAGPIGAYLARVTLQSLVAPSSTSCPPVSPTQPNVWTAPLLVAAPSVPSAALSTSSAPAAAVVTPLDTGRYLCP